MRLEARHVIAVTVDEDGDAASAQTYVCLSSVPMDAGKVASAFQPSSAAEEQMGDGSAVLWVEGKDRDDILRSGRVSLTRADGEWRYMEADLDSVSE